MVEINAKARVDGSGYDAQGFSGHYDAFRPQPPNVVLDILIQISGVNRPKLVVDLGCGTGLSTRPWATRVESVIGVEPNSHMRQQAELHSETSSNLSYRDGFSHKTSLHESSVDIVTCSQALHWMEPGPTFREIARVLRTGGVFGAYDYQMLPISVSVEVNDSLTHFLDTTKSIRTDVIDVPENAKQRWKSSEHFTRMEESGSFRQVRELWVHKRETRNVTELAGYCRSIDGVNRLIVVGNKDAIDAHENLKAELSRVMGDKSLEMYWSIHFWLGVH